MFNFEDINFGEKPNPGRNKINYNFSLVSGITLSNYFPLSGGTVTGDTYFTSAVTFNGGIYGNGSGLTNINEVNVVNQFSKLVFPSRTPYDLSANTALYRTFSVDLQNGKNLNLNLTNFMSGNSGSIILKQGTIGNSTVTLTGTSYNNYVMSGSGAVILTNSANAIDILRYLTDGTNVYWTVENNFT